MKSTASALLALIATAWLSVTPAAASATNTELDAQWSHYLANRSALEPVYRFPHSTCFSVAALEYDLPESLLLAVARGESDFDANARSRANAHGVMQILWPTTARHLGIHRLSELYEPCTNIDAGARYLKELLARYRGNLHLALAAYNYGPQRIATDGTDIPSGATWYSGYIVRHLNYVLDGAMESRPRGDSLYAEIGQSTLLTFGEPYRAEAFIAGLEDASPDLSLDWFRRGTGEFEVVMTYADREAFERSVRWLESAGFRVDP